MAYRKTEKVIAQLEARKSLIVAAAADVIAKGGIEALSTEAIAARAEIAVGAIYKYFPDKHEILAAVIAKAIERDVAALRAAAEAEGYPINAFASALAVLYSHMKEPLLVNAIASHPAYSAAVREELAKLIKGYAPDITPTTRKLLAAAAFGSLVGSFAMAGPGRWAGKAACTFALRGLGVPQAAAERLTA